MFSKDIAIHIQSLSKRYQIYDRPEDRLKQFIIPKLQRFTHQTPKNYFREFWALKDISFEVRKGETIGIIGRNGSGKSTLLQIICGTLASTTGSIQTAGRIAALLELGSGFNPEFTGRENVYLNGAILGFSREEIDSRFEAIIRFADIGDFIEQPLKTYSSGMYVRLAFATAINVDPSILIVDEALAVGDEAFQRKCFARIEEIKEKGGTILFVSHSTQTIVQFCDRAMLFDSGEMLLEGRPKMVVSQYQRLVNLTGKDAQLVKEQIRHRADLTSSKEQESGRAMTEMDSESVQNNREINKNCSPNNPVEYFDPHLVSKSKVDFENHGVEVRNLRLLNSKNEHVNVIELGRRYSCCYDVSFHQACQDVGFGIGIRNVSGFSFGGANYEQARQLRLESPSIGSCYSISFEFVCILLPGTYFINFGVIGSTEGERRYLARSTDGLLFRVAPQDTGTSGGYIDFGIQTIIKEKQACDRK